MVRCGVRLAEALLRSAGPPAALSPPGVVSDADAVAGYLRAGRPGDALAAYPARLLNRSTNLAVELMLDELNEAIAASVRASGVACVNSVPPRCCKAPPCYRTASSSSCRNWASVLRVSFPPLRKNVGVPVTPRAFPSAMSRRIRSLVSSATTS